MVAFLAAIVALTNACGVVSVEKVAKDIDILCERPVGRRRNGTVFGGNCCVDEYVRHGVR